MIKVRFLIPACSRQKQVTLITTLKETRTLARRGGCSKKRARSSGPWRHAHRRERDEEEAAAHGCLCPVPVTIATGANARGLPGSTSSSRNAARSARSPARCPLAAEGETADVRSASRLAHAVTRGLVHKGGLL